MGAAPARALTEAAPARTARAYAEHLLQSLGAAPLRPLALEDEHPALAWARSGLMRLTGRPDGAGRMCPAPVAACADGALAALASLAPAGAFGDLRGGQLLGERAAIAGTTRAGTISPGGSCRLLEAADGWIALNLARDEDWDLVPAWLELEVARDWGAVAAAVRAVPAQALVERGRDMGLAIAPDAPRDAGGVPWFSATPSSPRKRGSTDDGVPASLDARLRGHDDGAHGGRRGQDLRPLVIDLSSLWAGPLCGHLLQRAGCEVVKVESLARPDGARAGPPAFFDLLNAGKSCVALDFAGAQGRAQLRALLAAADIVIEASRPRALRQLGIDAGELLAENPSLTWIGISGYGRDGARENWIAYGDDAGVAAGLSRLMHDATGERLFCGDAIADPLAGLHAALAGWAAHRAGGGRIVSVALRDVAAHVAAFDAPASPRGARERAQAWSAVVAAAGIGAARPLARVPAGAARPLGSDTAAVLARLGIP